MNSQTVSGAPREISKKARKYAARNKLATKQRNKGTDFTLHTSRTRHVAVCTDLWPCCALSHPSCLQCLYSYSTRKSFKLCYCERNITKVRIYSIADIHDSAANTYYAVVHYTTSRRISCPPSINLSFHPSVD